MIDGVSSVRRIRYTIALGCRGLASNPLRAVLSTLGVMIGVASLVAMLSFGDGLAEFVQGVDSARADIRLVTVSPVVTERVRHVPVPVRSALDLQWEHVESLTTAVGDAGRVVLARQQGVRPGVGAEGGPDFAIGLVAATPGWPTVRGSDPVVHGRDLSSQDLELARRVAVVSEDALSFQGLPNDGSALGSWVDIGSWSFEVVGVLREGDPFLGARAVVPLTLDLSPELDPASTSLFVRAAQPEQVDEVERDVRAWLATTFPSAPYHLERGGLGADLNVQRIRAVQLLVGAIIGIAILVGGIGIMNVMLASVIERTREIGIRRAAGARRADILWQFVCEAIAVSSVGSGVGLFVGLGIAYGTTWAIRAATDAPLSASVTVPTLLVVAGVAVIVGVLFGLYPARRAANLTPVEAMRHE